MFYAYCKTYFLCFCISLVKITTYATQQSENIERLTIMNNQNDPKSNWLSFVHEKTTLKKSGTFYAQDKIGKTILLEWSKVDPTLPEFNEKIKSNASILIETFTKQELEFAKKHPEVIPQEHFLKSLEPLLKKGLENVDWNLAEAQLKNIFEEFFTKTDLTKFASPNEVQFLVIAKNKETDELLGLIQFFVTEQDQYGSVKAGMISVNSKAINNDLEILLMSSIFKIIPSISRIYLHTRATNQTALSKYQNLGFTQFYGPIAYWQDMEYLVDKSDILQKKAKEIS